MGKPNEPASQPSTEAELLVALLGRIVRTEAAVDSFVMVALKRMAHSDDRREAERIDDMAAITQEEDLNLQRLYRAWLTDRKRLIGNQLDSLAVQFPQFEKLLRDHLSVAESDTKDLWREDS